MLYILNHIKGIATAQGEEGENVFAKKTVTKVWNTGRGKTWTRVASCTKIKSPHLVLSNYKNAKSIKLKKSQKKWPNGHAISFQTNSFKKAKWQPWLEPLSPCLLVKKLLRASERIEWKWQLSSKSNQTDTFNNIANTKLLFLAS